MAPSKGNNKNNFRKKKPEKNTRMLAIFKKNWPTDAATTEIKLGNIKSVQYYVPFFILTGTKHPEPFLIWLHDYRSKIANNIGLTWEERYNLILTMVKGEAKARVQEVFVAVLEPTFTVIADKDNFDWKSLIVKHWQKNNLETTKAAACLKNWKDYYNATTDEYKKHVLQEIEWNLGLLIWGTDYDGRNASTKIKQMIQTIKMVGQMNAKAYKTCMREFQKYTENILLESYALLGMKPPKFTKSELRNMLANAVTETQENKLISQWWRITTNGWNESLNKLGNLEQTISREETMR